MESAQQTFDLLEVPKIDVAMVPELSPRDKIVEMLRAASQKYGLGHATMFNKLYQQYYYRHNNNLQLRAKNADCKNVLEYAEKNGFIDSLYLIAAQLIQQMDKDSKESGQSLLQLPMIGKEEK